MSKRPFKHLPLKLPSEHDYGPEFFYNNFVSHFIPDMIKMMNAGINIDEQAVERLRSTVDNVLSEVDGKLLRNKIIQQYQDIRSKNNQEKHYKKHTKNIRTWEDFYKDYNEKDIQHRTFLINHILKTLNCEKDCKNKWTVKELKLYNTFKEDPNIEKVINKSLAKKCDLVTDAMKKLAEYKSELWNRPRYDKANSKATLDPFNAGSSTQKQELFEMLSIEPYAHSDKTGDGSWGREYIEQLKKETPEENKDLHEILSCIIDYSYGSIIKNNFIKAFDTYTLDNVLHGNIKLFGAKSFRPTSNAPNLLNMPSTGSVYAKPLKKCFVPPEGMLIIQCDYSSLEDVVLANLTLDEGKLAIQKDKTLDAHCYNAMGYYTKEIEEVIGKEGNFKDKVRKFKKEVANKNLILSNLRQSSKPITFKLAYGGYPDEHKGGAISQEVFDNYHNVLYPKVNQFLKDYVIPTTKEKGYLHLGLGCRIYSDDPDSDSRTLFNACFQFWSILTLIAVNEINYRIEKAGYEKDIILHGTIYDSIYTYIKPDPKIIKWYNDNIVEIGRQDFIPNQQVPNTLECGIGRNWAEEIAIPSDASIKDIEEILQKLKEN